ncbi:MAG: hypothetical protein ACOYNY_11340 [Caldilineaceae bacterium]
MRVTGNEVAHEFDANITFEDADILINLCDAIVSYVYEAPQLIYKIQSKLRKSEA